MYQHAVTGERLYTAPQIAEVAGVTDRSIQRYAKAGDIEYIEPDKVKHKEGKGLRGKPKYFFSKEIVREILKRKLDYYQKQVEIYQNNIDNILDVLESEKEELKL